MRIQKLSSQARQATPKLLVGCTSRGFSLIELLIVVVILGVVAAIAAPNFQNTIENNRVNSAAEGMRDAIAVARTEAIRQGTQVTLQPNCSPPNWSCGWKIATTGGANTDPIRVGDFPSVISVSLSSGQNELTFNPNGTFRHNNAIFIFRVQGQSTGGRALELGRSLRICSSGSSDCPI